MQSSDRTIDIQAQLSQINFTPGMTLGSYRVLRKIGSGGMGAVYEVEQIYLHHRYALKTLFVQGESELERQDSIDRFLLEARIMSQLRHTGIVTIQTLEQDNKTKALYYVMDYVAMTNRRKRELLNSAFSLDATAWYNSPPPERTEELEALSLEDLYQYGKRLKRCVNPELIRKLTMDVAEALDYAHTLGDGIIHRDIKPANILIRENGRAVLADFGVAKIADATLRKSVLRGNDRSLSLRMNTGGEAYHLVLGTIEYMAPELRAGSPPSPRTDLYALGATLYQLLTGKMPSGNTFMPSAYGLHPCWDTIIEKCMAINPDERFASLKELYCALVDFPKAVQRYRLKQIAYWTIGLGTLFASITVSTVLLLPFLLSIVDPSIRPSGKDLWVPKPLPSLTFQFIEYTDHIALKSVHPDTCGFVEIPSHIKGKPVTQIEPDAFRSTKQLLGVYLPEDLLPSDALMPVPIKRTCPEPECEKCKLHRIMFAGLPSNTAPYALLTSPARALTAKGSEEVSLEWSFTLHQQSAWIKQLNTEVEGESLELPSELREGFPVVGIHGNALQKANVRHLVVPPAIVSYKPEALARLPRAISAILPKGDLETATGLFSNSPKLQAVKIDLQGTELPEDCFKNCPNLKLLILENTSETLWNAFKQFAEEGSVQWDKMQPSLRNIGNEKTQILLHTQEASAVYILEQQSEHRGTFLPSLIRPTEKPAAFSVRKATSDDVLKFKSLYKRLSADAPLQEEAEE